MIDCKNCGFFTNPSNYPIIKLMNAIYKKIIHFYFTKLLAIQLRGDLWAAAVSRDH